MKHKSILFLAVGFVVISIIVIAVAAILGNNLSSEQKKEQLETKIKDSDSTSDTSFSDSASSKLSDPDPNPIIELEIQQINEDLEELKNIKENSDLNSIAPEVTLILNTKMEKKYSSVSKYFVSSDISFSFSLRSRKIKNIFMDEGLFGLHIEFGTKLMNYKNEFDKIEDFNRNRNRKYEELVHNELKITHNYSGKDKANNIMTALDTIKQNGLDGEIDRQLKFWSNDSYFSVLLTSKDESLLKPFVTKLRAENSNHSMFCGKNKELYCDAFDIKLSDDPKTLLRVFLAYKDKRNLEAFKLDLISGGTEADVLKKLPNREDNIVQDMMYYKPQIIGPEASVIKASVIIEQIKRRGFKTFVSDIDELDKGANFYFVIKGDLAHLESFKLMNPKEFDYKIQGEEKLEVKDDPVISLESEDDNLHKLRVHRVKNLFGRKEFYGLLIEFDVDGSNNYDTKQLLSFDSYINLLPNPQVTTYDGMFAVHNQSRNNLLEFLDKIRIGHDDVCGLNALIGGPLNFLFISDSNENIEKLKFGGLNPEAVLNVKYENNELFKLDSILNYGFFEIYFGLNQLYRFFYASRDLSKIEAFKKHVRTVKFISLNEDEGSVLYKNLLKPIKRIDLEGVPVFTTDFEEPSFSIENMLNQIKIRGFKGYFDDFNNNYAKLFDKYGFFLMVPSICKEFNSFKFDGIQNNIDLKKFGTEKIIITKLLDIDQVVTNDNDGTTSLFKLESLKFENVYGQLGLFGLRIGFDKVLGDPKPDKITLAEDSHITAYNGIAVVHKYNPIDDVRDENGILTVLETIKNIGLSGELDRQFELNHPSINNFSVLLVSNDEGSFKEFEDKLKVEQEELAVVNCGKDIDLYCDVLEVTVSDPTPSKYKVFLAYKKKIQLIQLKKELKNELKKSEFDQHFSDLNFDLKQIIGDSDDIKRKGFKSMIDQNSFRQPKVYYTISDKEKDYDKFYLYSLKGIDFKQKSEAIVSVGATQEITFTSSSYMITWEYKVLANRISNIFGRKDLSALLIRFGVRNEATINIKDFESINVFMQTGYKNADYDRMLVIHNQPDSAGNIVTVLDAIKKDSGEEFRRQSKDNLFSNNGPINYLLIGDEKDINEFRDTFNPKLNI